MNSKCLVFATSLLLLNAAPSAAERARSSMWLPETSLTFERNLEPLAGIDTEYACRDICEKDVRCSGWTYYHSDFVGAGPRETWEPLRRTCVVGAGIKDRNFRGAPGRTSGEIMLSRECAPIPGVDPRSYMC
jgi:hypothetical protein